MKNETTRAGSRASRHGQLQSVTALVSRDFAHARSYSLALYFDFLFGLIDVFIYFFISEALERLEFFELSGSTNSTSSSLRIIVALVVAAAGSEIAQRLREEQLAGTLEMLVAQPVSPAEIGLGTAGFPLLYALARAGIYLAFGAAVLDLDLGRTSWIGVGLMLVSSSLLLLALGLLIAAAVIVFKRQVIGGLVSTALAFGGGAFFPLDVLPHWLHSTCDLLPTRFIFDGTRAALCTGTGWSVDLLVLVAYSAALLPVSLWAFSLSINAARRSASLGQY